MIKYRIKEIRPVEFVSKGEPVYKIGKSGRKKDKPIKLNTIICRCYCGKAFTVLKSVYDRGVKSCGCVKRGKDIHPLNTILEGMIARCYNPKSTSYKNYGAKGIKICDRWLVDKALENIVEDLGERPSLLHTIDRINSNRDYEPENCRWATKKEQSNNTKTNVILEYKGDRKTIMEWSDKLAMNHMAIRSRLRRGWSIEKTLETPLEVKGPRNLANSAPDTI